MNRDSQIISLYRQGKGIKAIAKALGTNHMAIKRTLIRLGVYHNLHQEPGVTVTTQGNNEVTEDNQLCKTHDNEPSLQEYQKDLCKNRDNCPVCSLEQNRFIQIKELYMLGTPAPILCSYFGLTAKDLADHAFAKNWHKQKAKWEDPRRKQVIQEALENEVWRTIIASEAGGDAGDKIAAMKLAAQVRGMIDTGPKVAVAVSWEQRLAGITQGQKQLEGRQEVIEIDFEEGQE